MSTSKERQKFDEIKKGIMARLRKRHAKYKNSTSAVDQLQAYFTLKDGVRFWKAADRGWTTPEDIRSCIRELESEGWIVYDTVSDTVRLTEEVGSTKSVTPAETPVTAHEEPPQRFCGYCGQPMKPGSRFCAHCGAAI